jgi:RNase H-fold protein (predicted Holliday junction resolvase)
MTIKKAAKNSGSSDVVVQSPKESHESDDDNRSNNKATSEKLNKKSYPEITIIYEDERLKVNLDAKGFSFQAVDAWIRSRFGIQPTDPLRYMDKLGAG